MPNDKPYISASQLTMYEKCGEQYRRRYIENEKIPPGIAMVKGIGVHDGARGNYRQKIESHQDLPSTEIVEMAVAAYEKSIANGVMMTPDEKETGESNVIAAGKDSVVTLTNLFSNEVAPAYQPAWVEEKQRLILTEASHDLMAVMDMATVDELVTDLKTTGKKKNQDEADQSEQLSFYALVYRALTGKLPRAVRLDVLIEKKTPEYQILDSIRTDVDLTVLLRRINTMLDGLKKGVFIPAQATAWQCNPRWCGYYLTCPYVKN